MLQEGQGSLKSRKRSHSGDSPNVDSMESISSSSSPGHQRRAVDEAAKKHPTSEIVPLSLSFANRRGEKTEEGGVAEISQHRQSRLRRATGKHRRMSHLSSSLPHHGDLPGRVCVQRDESRLAGSLLEHSEPGAVESTSESRRQSPSRQFPSQEANGRCFSLSFTACICRPTTSAGHGGC